MPAESVEAKVENGTTASAFADAEGAGVCAHALAYGVAVGVGLGDAVGEVVAIGVGPADALALGEELACGEAGAGVLYVIVPEELEPLQAARVRVAIAQIAIGRLLCKIAVIR